MEGFIKLIKKSCEEGDLGGVRISDMTTLSHLLFVDDVLIFLNGSFRGSHSSKNILSLFCKATGMEPNYDKSSIIFVT